MIMIMKRHEQTYFLSRFLRAVEVYKVPICYQSASPPFLFQQSGSH